MNMRLNSLFLAGLLSLCVVVSAAAVSAQTYHVTDLGTLGGDTSHATRISTGGMVVGNSSPSDPIDLHAFVYDGTLHDLGTLGGIQSLSSGINTNGKIVGWAQTDGNAALRAFLYDGTMHDLGTLGGQNSEAADINSSGKIVGFADLADGFSHAFSYDGAMHDLGTLGGSFSEANAISNNGNVVGQASTTNDNAARAFLYNGVMHDLGTLGGKNSDAYDINASGRIVGYSEIGDTLHAFLYDGTMHDLGTLGGYSEALGINSAGQIVGDSGAAGDGVGHAFVYRNGAMSDLNTRLDASGVGWVLSVASDINDSGWIVGTGVNPQGQTHAFLLTPVPEPSSLVLATMGIVGIVLRGRRFSLRTS